MAKIVNLRELRGKTPAGVVRVDRTTRWGNPFRMGVDAGRDEVVEQYREWLWRHIKARPEAAIPALLTLHSKTLACWCAPERCHAEVLAAAADWAMGIDLMATELVGQVVPDGYAPDEEPRTYSRKEAIRAVVSGRY